MKILIAIDLEGIHGVVGEPYAALSKGLPTHADAVEKAITELNTVIGALREGGCDEVDVWDNHGGGNNIDLSRLDHKVGAFLHAKGSDRFKAAEGKGYDGVFFLGYHAMEGTRCGVLAHTFSSVGIQYAKLNGTAIGELFCDVNICRELGIPTLYAACDDVCKRELLALCPGAVCTVTKIGKGRNSAELIPEEELLKAMHHDVLKAIKHLPSATEAAPSEFPAGATLEVRYTRAEKAGEMLLKAQELNYDVAYGEDTHVLIFKGITRAAQIPHVL